MIPHYFMILFLVFENSFGFKANHQINRQTKSIFSNKKCSELLTPARYKAAATQNFNFDQPIGKNYMLEQYFPDVAYPTNIMEASRPFFYNTGECNPMLGPFPDDVKSSYKDLMDKNKKAFEEKKSINMNLFFGNCLQENIDPTPKEETTIEETVVVSKENESQVYVEKTDEVAQEVSQDVLIVEDITVEEIESNDNTSDLEEIFEENEGNSNVIPPANESEETEVITEDFYQSWESEEIYSKEIITQLSETDGMGSVS